MAEKDVHSMNMQEMLDKFEAVVRADERQRCYEEITMIVDEMGGPDPTWLAGINRAAEEIRPKKAGS